MSKQIIDKRVGIVSNMTAEILNCEVLNCEHVGKGANGNVYRLDLSTGDTVAVKYAESHSIIADEYKYNRQINDRVDIRMPKIRFCYSDPADKTVNLLCMDYIDGINADDPKLLRKPKSAKNNFRMQLLELLERLQNVHNDKYGSIDNAVYDDWHDYYRPFAGRIIEFAESKTGSREFLPSVSLIMRKAYDNYDRIFDEPIGPPTLTHGDLWLPNIMVDKDTLDVLAIIDPFNVMWAEPDYELFALVAGLGNKYKLYEAYKDIRGISDKCDLKIEFYALFSEVYWYSITHRKYDSFMKYKARLLNKQMRRFGIK